MVSKIHEYTEPEAKSAIVWIIGEYGEKIKDCYKIFTEHFNFIEESDSVKLQILTTSVKMYLKMPEECEDMI